MSAAMTPEQVKSLRELMMGTFYRGWNEAYFAGPSFESDMHAHTTRRFEECRDIIMPWIERYLPFEGKTVADIGCGTGASTAAWALKARRVLGYDIHGPSVEAAVGRMRIMGLTNVTCQTVTAEGLIAAFKRDLADGADAIVMYAVLEHQMVRERIDTLRAAWALLRPGGVLVLGDTPTRFAMMDYHTSLMPFYQWLPEELAVLYAHRSPRADFRDGVAASLKRGMPAAIEYIWRCGRAAGYEEFELALGPLDRLVVGDSFDEGMVDQPHRGVTLLDELIQTFAAAHDIRVPRGFLRPSLEVILRKPMHPDEPPPPRRPAPVEGLMRRSQVEELVRERLAQARAQRGGILSRARQWIRGLGVAP
ncbi:MAG: methyltransferase domain-containing protein [Phycisphaerales bacterium]|nr:methyltransferase domain-containing protein [Phycisphaerales bacterium]